jgi:hypothetical protein
MVIDITTIFAIIALVIFVILAIFQIALVFGAPLGKFAWGGQHNKLPIKFRVGSIFSIAIYACLSIFVLTRVGWINFGFNQNVISVCLWIAFAYFVLGILMNAISRSKPERAVMTPVSAALALCFLMLAI